MLSSIERIAHALDRLLLAAGCLFLAVMMLHITLDVALRWLLNAPIIGTLETVSYYHIVLAVFLPLAFVERTDENIKVDLFVQMMPDKVQFALYLLAASIGLAYFGALTYQTFLDALRSTMRAETIMSNFLFYIWPSRWALPIGFGAACLAILANMLRALARRQPL